MRAQRFIALISCNYSHAFVAVACLAKMFVTLDLPAHQ